MLIDDVISLFERERFTDIRVTGIGFGEASHAHFSSHLERIYFEFEEAFVEFRQINSGGEQKIKLAVVRDLDFKALGLHEEDDATVITS